MSWVDISKRTLDFVLYLDMEYFKNYKIENSLEEIYSFIELIKLEACKVSNTIFCAESTGIYGHFLEVLAT